MARPAKRWDMADKSFCIAELKYFLDQMRNGDRIDILNVTQDELNLMKVALDCYCNVGEVIAKIAETVGKIDKGLESTLSPTYTGPAGTAAGNATTSYASGTALSPYAAVESEAAKDPRTATEIALKRQEEAMRILGRLQK